MATKLSMPKFKKGDEVRIVKKVEPPIWNPRMDELIGRIGKVKYVGVWVSVEFISHSEFSSSGHIRYYNSNCLELYIKDEIIYD